MLKFADIWRKQPDELLTAVEVCSALRISRRTLYRLIDRKHLPCTKVGGRYRFLVREVRAYCQTISRAIPFYFKSEVLQRYFSQPDKYEVHLLPNFSGWITIKPVPGGSVGAELVHYHQRQLPGDEKVIVLTPLTYHKLPPPEKAHWNQFEIT